MSMIETHIIPVRTRSELNAFTNLPWKLYQGDPNWVPPLKSEFKKLFDVKKNPFWFFSERRLYLAVRGKEAVGRIVAIVDGNYNKKYNERMGAWGYFECEDDAGTAAALFDTADLWLKQQGMNWSRGPLNPSINHEMGLLVHGFDKPPVLGFTYNRPYYQGLMESCGFEKEKDVYTYYFERGHTVPDWFLELGDSLTQKNEFRIRPVNLKKFDEEVELINDLYNECWEENWGSAPMTREELQMLAGDLKQIVDPDLLFFIYHQDEPIGVNIVVPDANPLFQRFNGRVRLIPLIKELTGRSAIYGLRGYILGIKKPYRQTGAPLVVFDYLINKFKEKTQYQYMETGWQLEDNHAINTLFEDVGGRREKIFRVYGRKIDGSRTGGPPP